MEKTTDVFDRLDNVIGNYMDGKATAEDVVAIASQVNKYLIMNPHPHDMPMESGQGWMDEAIKKQNSLLPHAYRESDNLSGKCDVCGISKVFHSRSTPK